MLKNDDYYNFVRYSLGQKVTFGKSYEMRDFYDLYCFSQKQAIVGVLFEGIKRIY